MSRFVVQLHDQSISRIVPGAPPYLQPLEKPAGVLPRGTLEVWPYLVAAGIVLLVAEWLVYLTHPTRLVMSWAERIRPR